MRLLDKIDAGFLPWPEFERAVGALPLVSVDWVLLNPAGQMLLGHRRNAPARHWWFRQTNHNTFFATVVTRSLGTQGHRAGQSPNSLWEPIRTSCN